MTFQQSRQQNTFIILERSDSQYENSDSLFLKATTGIKTRFDNLQKTTTVYFWMYKNIIQLETSYIRT